MYSITPNFSVKTHKSNKFLSFIKTSISEVQPRFVIRNKTESASTTIFQLEVLRRNFYSGKK